LLKGQSFAGSEAVPKGWRNFMTFERLGNFRNFVCGRLFGCNFRGEKGAREYRIRLSNLIWIVGRIVEERRFLNGRYVQ
jgi:hypothetical protein